MRRSGSKANIAPELEIPTLDTINERIRLLEGVFQRIKGKGIAFGGRGAAGGTGRPIFVICARFAPLPPRGGQ